MANTVKKEELIGFRKPQLQEQKLIYDYYVSQKKKSGKVRDVMKIVYICFLAFFVLGMLGLGMDSKNVGEQIVIGLMTVVAIGMILMANKSRKEDKQFLSLIESGQYQVMDCMVYKTDTATNMVNKAIVYIYNQSGQYCDERFPVDRVSVNEWTMSGAGKFLLVKVSKNKFMYYELFTPKKLEWR